MSTEELGVTRSISAQFFWRPWQMALDNFQGRPPGTVLQAHSLSVASISTYSWFLCISVASGSKCARPLLSLQVGLGKFEGGPLAQSFMRMGDKAELLSKSAREQSVALSHSFEAPLKVRVTT